MLNLPNMFEPPAGTGSVPTLDDYIQPNLGHALRIWWAYYWPTTLIALVSGSLLGLIVRLLYENFIVSAKPLIPVTKYGGYVINYVAAFFVMRYILGKTFRHFRLGLVSNAGASPAQMLKPTFARTLRVWWIFTWRTVLYGLLCLALVLYPMGWFVGIFRPSPLFANLFFLLFGTATGGALALFVIYSNILDEDIGDFRVAVLPRQDVVPGQNPLASDLAPLG
ncbi:MAG: hypothetical protein ACYDCG_01885 [Candidatus Acidiferrales bacterium]